MSKLWLTQDCFYFEASFYCAFTLKASRSLFQQSPDYVLGAVPPLLELVIHRNKHKNKNF